MLQSWLHRVVFEDQSDLVRPRVWPCFVIVPVAMALYTLFASAYSMFAFNGFYFTEDPAWGYGGWRLLIAYAGSIVALCLGVLIAAFVPAWLSRTPVRERLLLVPSGLSPLRIFVIALGSIFISIASSYVLWVAYMVLPGFIWSTGPGWDPYGYENSIIGATVLALVTGVAPGIAEELLFRGYIQSRLLRRWPAPVAIGVTSVLFGIYHMNAEQLFTTSFMGLWLGVIAWRTGSVVPGMAAHVAINVFASLTLWAGYEFDWMEADYGVLSLVAGIVSFGFFYLAVRALWSHRPVPWRRAESPGPGPRRALALRATMAECVAGSLATEPRMLPHIATILDGLEPPGCDILAATGMIEAAGDAPGRMMDLGCGTGALPIALAGLGWCCYAVEGLEPFVESARSRAARLGLGDRCRFSVGDLRDRIDGGGAYDLVALCGVGPFAGGHARTIERIRTMVRPGGLVLIDDGFLAADAGAGAQGFIGFARLEATRAQLQSHGDRIIGERISTGEESRGAWEGMLAAVQPNAEAYIESRPDIESLLRGHLRAQGRRRDLLGRVLIRAMWLLRRSV